MCTIFISSMNEETRWHLNDKIKPGPPNCLYATRAAIRVNVLTALFVFNSKRNNRLEPLRTSNRNNFLLSTGDFLFIVIFLLSPMLYTRVYSFETIEQNPSQWLTKWWKRNTSASFTSVSRVFAECFVRIISRYGRTRRNIDIVDVRRKRKRYRVAFNYGVVTVAIFVVLFRRRQGPRS